VDADLAARAVVEPGTPALAAIAAHFGADILQADGSLDRAQLRQRVFADPAERQWLERLTHPLIREDIARGLSSATSPYVLLVSPLLVESGQSKLTQRVLVVDVPEDLQLQRTMVRDNNPETQVKAIMQAQASRQQRLLYADDVIVNDSTLADLKTNVARLHQHYLQLAAEKPL
jgi:dephospho-CoA kinase